MPSFDTRLTTRNPLFRLNRPNRRGLTLVEILVAMTMTLIILGAMMAAFQYASVQMQDGRAVMEMASRARSVEDQLRIDLAGLSIDPRPYTDSAEPNGYFEINERPRRDDTEMGGTESYLGDVDDVLGMTVRARNGVLFRGRGPAGTLESSLAEVVWFTSVKAAGEAGAIATAIPTAAGSIPFDSTVRLHRRQLLIRPDLGTLVTDQTPVQVNALLSTTDISCRVVPGSAAGVFNVIANNLTDLARRENRFAHNISAFPHPMDTGLIFARAHSLGEDIMLTDVVAFDLRVYSPNAEVVVDSSANIAIEPGDVGTSYTTAVTSSATEASLDNLTIGAFVDLDHFAASGWFAGTPSAKSQLAIGGTAVWDSWSPSYEADGIDQDGDTLFDEGTNGVNNGGSSAPDDNLERETEPPYPNPIRGVKVTLRLIEKGTKKVFQTSIVHSYVPE
ncbi:MAG: prepilin-type N-terminal cleavage/methylation domain-containing protein [Planctomycetota bacterium]